MEDLFATLINIAFYIFIFKILGGLFSKKTPQKKQEGRARPVVTEKMKKRKKKESFLEEIMNQLKTLEPNTEKKEPKEIKTIIEKPVYKEELKKPSLKRSKESDEKTEEIYYNDRENKYIPGPGELRKAIIFSEIIGKPVSKRHGVPYRR